MFEKIVAIALIGFGIYLLIGVIFYFPFMKQGVHLIDKVVKGTTKIFKILVFPGIVALWPLLYKKWRAAKA